jgi:serine/threonine protein kinase
LFFHFKECREDETMMEIMLKRGKVGAAEMEATRAAVCTAREAYNEAVRHLMAVVAAGYPEIASGATVSTQTLLPHVPLISSSELQSIRTLDIAHAKGHGLVADVFVMELPVTGEVAFKRFRDSVNADELLLEANMLWTLRHPNVVRLLHVCVDEGMHGLVLEYMEGGSLAAMLRNTPSGLHRSQVMVLFRDIMTGMAFIHANKQLHCDMKSDNVLLDASHTRAKIADFGSMREHRQTLRSTRPAFTPQWSAPELEGATPLMSPGKKVVCV